MPVWPLWPPLFLGSVPFWEGRGTVPGGAVATGGYEKEVTASQDGNLVVGLRQCKKNSDSL